MGRRFYGANTERPVEIEVTPDSAKVVYTTSDVINLDMDAPEITTLTGSSPEENYRKYDEAAEANPASPSHAALGWIGANTSLPFLTLGMATAPVPTILALGGNALGQISGNKAAELLENPDKQYNLNIDTQITPRQVMQHGFGFLGGLAGGGLGRYGVETVELPTGAETARVWTRRWSPYVYKESSNTPKIETIRGLIPGSLKTKFLRETPEGNYVYRLLKVFPTNKALVGVEKLIIDSGLYRKQLMSDGDYVYISPIRNEWVTDLRGNVGKTLFGKDVAFDLMSLTPEEGEMLFYKYGGLLRKYGNKKDFRNL